ncbi:MAG: ATP synthase F1 subunit delta [Thermoanaerobaculia bacterium]|nr:ATP synthase F1 subunit delta [Thermoanaerobaculia bacterium]
MARLNEKEVAVARVYSRSMLDLATERGEEESLLEELSGLRSYVESDSAIEHFFTSPLIDEAERRTKLEKLLRGHASDLLADSLQVLNQHGRLGILPTIVETYRLEYQERHGHVDVRVSSAVPLADDVRDQLRQTVARLVGREPDLVEEIDPSLIGGMVVRVGDRKIDASVAKDLRELRARLEERAVEEVLRHRAAGLEIPE